VLYLFDLDGTLMTSAGSGGRAFARACHDLLGISRALDGITLHGNTDPSILEEACRAKLGRPPSPGEQEAVLERYLVHLEEELAESRVEVLPGVAALLERLEARGAQVGLATGNVEGGARLKLSAAGLWHRFPFGGFGSDHHERAELVRVAIARAERRSGRAIAREEIRLIGDTPRDIAAARQVGVRAIGVATGMHDMAALGRAGADEIHVTLESFAT
jgi:phosphoglycolate phosphatase-like HAD superfamily hydrolase